MTAPDTTSAAGALLRAISTGADDLAPERRSAYDRALAWLIVVPFTFPMWHALRGRDGDVAGRLRWAYWVNIAQSIALVAIIAVAAVAFLVLVPMIARCAAAL